jgi:hypothetical protein
MEVHFRQQHIRGTLKLSNYYWITMQMSICRVMSLLLWSSMLTHIWAGGEYGIALQAAASEGHLEIVQLLLKYKADVNLLGNMPIIPYFYAYYILAGGKYGTALRAAEVEGHIEIAQLLMEHQADVIVG